LVTPLSRSFRPEGEELSAVFFFRSFKMRIGGPSPGLLLLIRVPSDPLDWRKSFRLNLFQGTGEIGETRWRLAERTRPGIY
jgi:hypothetical protein